MTTEGAAPRNGRRNILLGTGILALLALFLGLYWLFFMRGFVTTDDARFDAEMVDVAPQVGGTLAEVLVREGDSVKKGETLYRLDTASLEAGLARAEAAVESARASLAVAEANLKKSEAGPRAEEIRMAQATEQRTRAQAEQAKSDWQRADRVFEQGATSVADHDRARTAWQAAEHTHDEAAAHLKLLQLGTRSEDRDAARQSVELAHSQLAAAGSAAEEARIHLADAAVTAPFDGIVVRRWFDPGSAISVGKPVLTLMNPSTLHVSANVEEKDLHDISSGDPVEIHVDAWPALHLQGRVTTIIRATNSQFSLMPAEGVSGSFIKVTQRVPLRIDLERIPDEPLGPGLSVEIRIDTRGRSSGGALAERHD